MSSLIVENMPPRMMKIFLPYLSAKMPTDTERIAPTTVATIESSPMARRL